MRILEKYNLYFLQLFKNGTNGTRMEHVGTNFLCISTPFEKQVKKWNKWNILLFIILFI
jgi:hypothetical protein